MAQDAWNIWKPRSELANDFGAFIEAESGIESNENLTHVVFLEIFDCQVDSIWAYLGHG